MKKLLFLALLLIGSASFSQTTSELYKELGQLRKKANDLNKNFENGVGFCSGYYPEYSAFRRSTNKIPGYYSNKTINDYQNSINYLKKLKIKYLKQNGAHTRFISNALMYNKIVQQIKSIEQQTGKNTGFYYQDALKNKCNKIENLINSDINDLEKRMKRKSSEPEPNKKAEGNDDNPSSGDDSQETPKQTGANPNQQNSGAGTNYPQLQNQNLPSKEAIIANSVVDFAEKAIALGLFKSDPEAKARRIARRNKITITSDFSEGLAVFSKGNTNAKVKTLDFGFLDENGNIQIEPTYTGAKAFSEGLAPIKNGRTIYSKWGYINKTEKIIIDKKYKEAYSFINGEALVLIKKKYLKINKTGEVIKTFEFSKTNKDDPNKFPDLIKVEQNGKSGWIDETGKIQIPIKYKELYPDWEGFSDNKNDIIRVKLNGEKIYINNKGVCIKDCHGTDEEFSDARLKLIWNDYYKTNELAWHIFEEHNSKATISKGIKLVKHSIELNENYNNLDTYANLLFMNEQYKEAYEQIKKAIEVANNDNIKLDDTSENLIREILKKEPNLSN